MKHRIHATTIALAVVAGTALTGFAAQGPTPPLVNNRPAMTDTAPTNGHTDPDLAKMIGIEPGYVFPGEAQSSGSAFPAGPRPSSAH